MMNTQAFDTLSFSKDIEAAIHRCQQALDDDKTLAELSGVSNDMLEDVYRRGLAHYDNAELEPALMCFIYLVMHQPWDRRFHMALGSVLHWQEEYQSAITFYGYALSLDARDPGPYFRIAQCLLRLEESETAIEMLEAAVSQSGQSPMYSNIEKLSRELLAEVTKQPA